MKTVNVMAGQVAKVLAVKGMDGTMEFANDSHQFRGYSLAVMHGVRSALLLAARCDGLWKQLATFRHVIQYL